MNDVSCIPRDNSSQQIRYNSIKLPRFNSLLPSASQNSSISSNPVESRPIVISVWSSDFAKLLTSLVRRGDSTLSSLSRSWIWHAVVEITVYLYSWKLGWPYHRLVAVGFVFKRSRSILQEAAVRCIMISCRTFTDRTLKALSLSEESIISAAHRCVGTLQCTTSRAVTDVDWCNRKQSTQLTPNLDWIYTQY